jgi:glycine betaine/proline transport system permease protein
VFIAIAVLFAWQAAGRGEALLTSLGLGFILVVGQWAPLSLSLYLCALAVVICVLVGGALGMWAAQNDRVSKILRPINDALQTMPQFVFLIPALMFFRVGEFTALIAVCLYAIVPPMRYVEHGLRTVPETVVEAARQMGVTGAQMLTQVKLPLAMPVVMLGINQTIMAALSMLTIAALVGTRDLGQQVYIALGKADAGQGLVAGVAIALIATISDRTLQAWARNRQKPV